MTALEKLKKASSLEDLATLLGYQASTLSYIVYKFPPSAKYQKFEILKRSGGMREISAPHRKLRKLQRHLANTLYACRDQIENENSLHPLSHGFRKKHSIITNARQHKRRRYVLNLDLHDYFPTFNFGRVRGFFIKNRHFSLDKRVATLIAQIACHENALPQGSPCSPIISDLIAHMLDVRLAQLAKQHKVTYSRYADDLSFSTNQKQFPSAIALLGEGPGTEWVLANDLIKRVEREGFSINPTKTRMQVRTSQQLVTGLTVNVKVNIRAKYYRDARAMCNSLFKSGSYYRRSAINGRVEVLSSLNPIEGILSHIHLVKNSADDREELEKLKKPTAARRLYARLLWYRHFVALDRPLIICEGKTDNVYLTYAIQGLSAFHPKLGRWSGPHFESAVKLFSYNNQAHKILQLSGGTGNLKFFLNTYRKQLQTFAHRPLTNPVIVLIDNDDGASTIFNEIKKTFNVTVSHSSSDDFYHLANNLYLIKTIENVPGNKSCIEDLFEPALLATTVDGKTFNPGNGAAGDGEYGKHIFAEKVIRPNAHSINFKGFDPLLMRIVSVIDQYKAPIPQLPVIT